MLSNIFSRLKTEHLIKQIGITASAFDIVRFVYNVYCVEFARKPGLATILAVMASLIIVYGSTRVGLQENPKLKQVYSTIGQVSISPKRLTCKKPGR
ncbi:hypothetical protein AT705_01860 [Pseudoalteromonas rubra]|uniref:Uncharacterized protein n=1 Tax=Pseudoalteromonas rubra TaxID=43658 RepID=A0A0U3I1U2_9GAMM|nr:hypothetical protein AT705_01860 [Pseudoalteromonas rubra]